MATTSIPSPRPSKAALLAADSSQWLRCRTRDNVKFFGVPSASEPGRYWLANQSVCQCPAFRFGRGRPCHHVLAVRLAVARTERAPVDLDAERQARRPAPPSPAPALTAAGLAWLRCYTAERALGATDTAAQLSAAAVAAWTRAQEREAA